MLADAGDTVAVPPAATAQATNSGSVTVRGVRDGVQCISCNIPYLVLNHAPVPGQQTDPAESVWKQYADKLIPAGGSTGQVLAKASAQDMDLYWADGTTTQTETTPHMLTNAGRSKRKPLYRLWMTTAAAKRTPCCSRWCRSLVCLIPWLARRGLWAKPAA